MFTGRVRFAPNTLRYAYTQFEEKGFQIVSWRHDIKTFVATEIADGTKEGRYKDCVHLKVGVNPSPTRGRYRVECAEDSLIFSDVASCPSDCNYFEDRQLAATRAALAKKAREEEEKRQKWKSRGITVLRLVPRFFAWFGNAPWQTQLLIIVLVLAVFAPRLIPPLTALVLAIFHGKVAE